MLHHTRGKISEMGDQPALLWTTCQTWTMKLTGDSLTGYIYATRDGSCNAGGFLKAEVRGR